MPEEDLGPRSQMKTPRNEGIGAGNVNIQKSMADQRTLTLTATPLGDCGVPVVPEFGVRRAAFPVRPAGKSLCDDPRGRPERPRRILTRRRTPQSPL